MRLRSVLLNKFFSLQMIIVILSLLLCIDLFFKAEDTFHESFLRTEMDAIMDGYQYGEVNKLPKSRTLKGFEGIENVPSNYQTLVRELPEGVYELSLEGQPGFAEEAEIRVAVANIENATSSIYLISNLPDGSGESLLTRDMFWLIALYFSIVACFGLWFSWVLSKKASIPLEILAAAVSGKRIPDNLFSNKPPVDEINALHQEIITREMRINKFIRREKNTIRNISHELRTPMTVLSSSLSLLKVSEKRKLNKEKMMQKMQYAIDDVTATIDAFLWLGREGDCQEEHLSCGTTSVNKAIERYQHIVSGKPITLVVNCEKSVMITCKDAIFYIVISNLIRNAFTYTEEGNITITLMNNIFSVTDTGPGIVDKKIVNTHQGFGYGLDIVNQVCAQMGWCFNVMHNEEEKGTQALVSFN
ncbi:sensor histidine kinase [Eionea flava]